MTSNNLTLGCFMGLYCVLMFVHDLSWLWGFVPFLFWLFFACFDALIEVFCG